MQEQSSRRTEGCSVSVCFHTSPCTVTVSTQSLQSLRSQRLLDRMNSQYNVCLSRCTECVICTFHNYIFSCSCIYCFNIKSTADVCKVVQCGISVWSSQCVFVSATYYKRKGLVLLLSQMCTFFSFRTICLLLSWMQVCSFPWLAHNKVYSQADFIQC